MTLAPHPLALELARRSSALRFSDLTPEAVDAAKVGIFDWVGVTLAGAAEPCARIVGGLVADGGESVIFGTPRRTGMLDAALVNGTASHALDFDDMSNPLGGHPTAPILPALFALADTRPLSGRDFITAYVAGFETENRIGRGVNFHHYMKGWHPTTTLGIFGTATAVAHLLKLDAERTATALAIAASLAAGLKANFGTMTKPLHVGHCARSGLFAALLARDDFTANHGAFEHKQGFLEVFNGPGSYDVAPILKDWAKPFEIVDPGIAIKQYPCCGSTHPAIDVMLDLVREHDLKPDSVVRIESWTHARRLQHTNRPDPQSALDAKFSVQHCLALALVDRAIKIEDFEGESWRNPAVRAILPRIQVAPYTTAQFPEDNHFGAEIKVTTADGQTLGGKIDEALGRGTVSPLPPERLREKFLNCAARALPAATCAALADAIERLEARADMRTLGALLVPPAAQRASA